MAIGLSDGCCRRWLLLGRNKGISGESISSLQVFPKVRGSRGERLENYFVDDDGCENSPSCLQCPLPVCKYDVPVGSKNWGFQNLGIVQAKSRL